MNTLNFLDANVWLALVWERHAHSEVARAWFEHHAAEEFYFCRFTQLTVLRLLTTRAVMGRDVRTSEQAWGIWDQVISDDRVGFLPEPVGIGERFRKHSRVSTVSPKLWADAYLTAFAEEAGLTLVTFDRGLKLRSGVAILVTGD